MLDHNLIISKASFEELTVKDQLLDKQFRTFFMEMVSPAVIDQAHRIFKYVIKYSYHFFRAKTTKLN